MHIRTLTDYIACVSLTQSIEFPTVKHYIKTTLDLLLQQVNDFYHQSIMIADDKEK